MADAIQVMMQKNQVLILTLPGKVKSYMSVGKLIIGLIEGETKKIAVEAKYIFIESAKNTTELEKLVRKFVSMNTKEKLK